MVVFLPVPEGNHRGHRRRCMAATSCFALEPPLPLFLRNGGPHLTPQHFPLSLDLLPLSSSRFQCRPEASRSTPSCPSWPLASILLSVVSRRASIVDSLEAPFQSSPRSPDVDASLTGL